MRLAYTAMTRARSRLVWTATDAGVDQGEHRPSRFLLAAAGDEKLGPPREAEREPVTLREAETSLRRSLLDAGAGPARRLAAARLLGAPDRPWWDASTFAGAVTPGPDTPVISGPFRLSPSQADSYQRCPRRYVMERRLRLGDSSSVYAHFGELTHQVLEVAEGEVISKGRRHADLGRVLAIVDQVWETAQFGTPQLNDAWKAKAVEMLTKLYERWPGKGEPVEVELTVESEIAGVRWFGRIDRLERSDEGLRVVDYKTGTSAPRADDAAESVQLGFYAMAVAAAHGAVVASEMWLPRVKSMSVTTRQLSMHLLPEVEEKLAAITREIAAQNWAPRVSGECSRCAFRRSCPAWPEGRGAFLS
jgi:RecB family exonuclease